MAQYHENPIERSQFRMVMLDDEIETDSIVRFIDLYIEQLNMNALGFKHTTLADTGRRPYQPSDMLKLYLYGYLNGVRSSRKLERECKINLEVQWLIHGNIPGYKTISNFRKDNTDAIIQTFREFVAFCDRLGLIGKTTMAIDGTRIRANNSKAKYITHGKLDKQMEYFETSIKEYLKELDVLDAQDEKSPDKNYISQKIAHAQKRLMELKELKENLPETGGIALTDPDSKRMTTNNQGNDICHNVQSVVDDKNKLVVSFDVVDSPVDQNQLGEIALKAKEELNIEDNALTILADKGYFSGKQIQKCEENHITPIVAVPKDSHTSKVFSSELFIYDEKKDVFICPSQQELKPGGTKSKTYYNTQACKKCPLRNQCTKSKDGRKIAAITGNRKVVQDAKKRYFSNPKIYKIRQQLVEHPFGTLKRTFKFNYFLLRGFRKVKAETALVFTAYNLKRVMNLCGIEKLRECLE